MKNVVPKTMAEAAFVADELRLFLDTHPCQETALQAYGAAACQVENCRAQLCYSIAALDAGKNGQWDWTTVPFPWEKEACCHVDV